MRDWQDAGVWDKSHCALLAQLREANQIDFSRCAVHTGGTDGPKEQFIHHAAGIAGNGSYIDDVICRLKDANTAWTSASDKTLEERIYYCQNWRHDVVALIDSAGEMVEQARYEAYGTPIGMPRGDVDMNGRVTSADTTQISAWDSGGTYDVRGDLNLDGDVNTTDHNTSNNNTGTTLARGVLSDDPDTVGNRNGYAGYIFDDKPGFETYHVRNRWYNATLARWLTRDPMEYVDGPNLYSIVGNRPVVAVDPVGLKRLVAVINGQNFDPLHISRLSSGSMHHVYQRLRRDPANIVKLFDEDSDHPFGSRFLFFPLCGKVCNWIKAQQKAACDSGCDMHGVAILGHSNGGDAARKAAKELELQGYDVDLLFGFDPIEKPVHDWQATRPVSGNVTVAVNYYQHIDLENVPLIGGGGWLFGIGNRFRLRGYRFSPGQNVHVGTQEFSQAWVANAGFSSDCPNVKRCPHSAIVHYPAALTDLDNRMIGVPIAVSCPPIISQGCPYAPIYATCY